MLECTSRYDFFLDPPRYGSRTLEIQNTLNLTRKHTKLALSHEQVCQLEQIQRKRNKDTLSIKMKMKLKHKDKDILHG